MHVRVLTAPIVWGAAVSFLFQASALGQSNLNVPGQFATIQGAIDAASNGDTVLVQSGIYQEFLDFRGKAITVKSVSGVENTTIDGVNPFALNSKSLVTFANGEGPGSILEGFRLINGGGNLIGVWYVGGGILCDGASPTIRNNTIEYNITSFGGGIACINGAAPQIENNSVRYNGAIDGGGIYCLGSSNPSIENNLISHNSATPYCQSGSLPPSGFGSQAGVSSHGGGIYVPGDAGYPGIIPGGGSVGGGGGGGGGSVISTKSCVGGHGGGIFCGNGSSPLIANNVIEENGAGAYLVGGQGGGVYCEQGSNASILANTIRRNSSITGGGIALNASSPIIEENQIEENSAPYQGAGIACMKNSDARIEQNVIRANSGPVRGGGIFVEAAAPSIVANKISESFVGNSGGGIYICNLAACNEACQAPNCDVTALPLIACNMIWKNEAGIGFGGGIFLSGAAVVINNTVCKNAVDDELLSGGGLFVAGGVSLIENNIFWENRSGDQLNQIFPFSAPVGYSIVQGGFGGWGNTSEDPLFENFQNDDYHIKRASPAVHAGNSAALLLPMFDFESDPRIIGETVDIGADEYRLLPPVVSIQYAK